jgi:hypothetical protein
MPGAWSAARKYVHGRCNPRCAQHSHPHGVPSHRIASPRRRAQGQRLLSSHSNKSSIIVLPSECCTHTCMRSARGAAQSQAAWASLAKRGVLSIGVRRPLFGRRPGATATGVVGRLLWASPARGNRGPVSGAILACRGYGQETGWCLRAPLFCLFTDWPRLATTRRDDLRTNNAETTPGLATPDWAG